MNFRKGKSIFLMLAAGFILLITVITLFFFRNDAVDPVPKPDSAEQDTPIYLVAADLPAEKQLFIHPQTPAPGDFMVVEAGPLASGSAVNLDFDFAGAVSTLYRVGNQLYAVIAICYDNEPSQYSLIIETDAEQTESKTFETAVNVEEKEFPSARFSMPADRTAGWTAERLAEDREKIKQARKTGEPSPLWLQRFILPLEGRVTSSYGAIRVINNNPPRRHTGIDIGAEEGTPVIAPNNGVVRLAEHLLAGGKTVIIDHGMDLSSAYMHMHSIAVEEGEIVERGDLIGTVGMTGYATGPHLHWEANIGQTPVNPEQLLEDDLLWIPPAYVEKMLSGNR